MGAGQKGEQVSGGEAWRRADGQGGQQGAGAGPGSRTSPSHAHLAAAATHRPRRGVSDHGAAG